MGEKLELLRQSLSTVHLSLIQLEKMNFQLPAVLTFKILGRKIDFTVQGQGKSRTIIISIPSRPNTSMLIANIQHLSSHCSAQEYRRCLTCIGMAAVLVG